LPYLFKRFQQIGGRFVQQKINSFEEILKNGHIDMIVNCTGLGSKYLANDDLVKPIRGQVTRVKAPWMYETILDDSDDGNYIIAKYILDLLLFRISYQFKFFFFLSSNSQNNVVLGGTHQIDDFNKTVSGADREFILVGCRNMVPSLENVEVEKEWVGLRPGRSSVRLEMEQYATGSW
jgi:D-amino-acid oxidase